MHGDSYVNKRFSDEYLNELAELMVGLFIVVMIALVIGIITGDTRFERRDTSTAQSHQVGILKDDGNAGMGKDAPSSNFSPAEKGAVVGCFIATVMTIGAIILNAKRKN